MKVKVTAILLIFSIGTLWAQEKRWSLEECVAYALENNISIEQSELNLESAKIDKSDALGNFLPNLNANATIREQTGLVLDPVTNSNVSGTIFSVSPNISTNLTLFDGLANFKRMDRAKLNALASQYQLDGIKDDIRLAVANAYLQIVSNKETLLTFQSQYAATDQDRKRTAELVEAGVLPKGDLLQVEATAATTEQQIVETENQVLLSRINLAQLLQLTDYENFDVAEVDIEVPPSNILDNTPKDIFAKALTFRNEIKVSESNVEIAEKRYAN